MMGQHPDNCANQQFHETPLMMAVTYSRLECAVLVLAAGADARDAANCWGKTVLQKAEENSNGRSIDWKPLRGQGGPGAAAAVAAGVPRGEQGVRHAVGLHVTHRGEEALPRECLLGSAGTSRAAAAGGEARPGHRRGRHFFGTR